MCYHSEVFFFIYFIFFSLNEPNQKFNVFLFRIWQGKLFLVYVSTGSMKFFECGDTGNKKIVCPHKVQNMRQRADDGDHDYSSNVGELQPQAMCEVHDSGIAVADDVGPSDRPIITVNQNKYTEGMMRVEEDTVTAEVSGVDAEAGIGEFGGNHIEPQPETSHGFEMSSDNEVVDDDVCSDISEISSQVMRDLYTLQELLEK